MYGNRTRKESYKLRKIGKFNFSLTLPPAIVDYLGAKEGDELYLHCNNNDVIISKQSITNKTSEENITLDGWTLELNSLCPFMRKGNIIFGYSVENQSYFYMSPTNMFMQLANKTTCLKRIQYEYEDTPPNKFVDLLVQKVESFN